MLKFFFIIAESLSSAEFESVRIFEISRSVLKILAKQFSFDCLPSFLDEKTLLVSGLRCYTLSSWLFAIIP